MTDLFDDSAAARLRRVEERLAPLEAALFDVQARAGAYARQVAEARAEIRAIIEPKEEANGEAAR